MIEKKPFRKYSIDESKKKDKVFAIKFNKEQMKELEQVKQLLEQPKDSTAIKQCFNIGAKVLHSHLFGEIIQEITHNKAKNKRLGIPGY